MNFPLRSVRFLACGLILSIPVVAAPPEPIFGFSPAAAERQRALERKFDAQLDPALLSEWMKRLAAKPNHVGSTHVKENADFIAAQFRSWGFETEIETFQVLFPTPKKRILRMVHPEAFQARLEEPALPEDSSSSLRAEMLPTYNAYSVDGDVTAPLVYVNYGVPKDYEILQQKGVDVKGKIVIARYGASWRGIKPKVAAEHGAVGCIIYSDPRDDGYVQGDVYPKGAWRNEHGAQRGSVADMPLYAGDPSTPFAGSVAGVKRLPLKEIPTLTKIPVLPISYADALPLLKALEGPVAPDEWRGGLPITYHLGPGPAQIHLHLEFDWKIVPAFNVVARLRGQERPDQWIIRGNHHDAWVFGAEDPLSGLVALMAEARSIGLLAKEGWAPKRTLIFTAWDAEEPGLLGSSEWVETHARELREHAAIYINSDNSGRGFLRVGGSHTLEKWINGIARDVIDPQRGIPVGERLRAFRLINGAAEDRRDAQSRADLRIGALGSGSDYTPFLQHLGIASLDIRYQGENRGGSYHSIYDSFDHYVRFGDPGFQYGIALAKTAGRAILRSAEASVLPFEFSNFVETVQRYATEVAKLADDLREETQRHNRLVEQRQFEKAADPRETFVAPRPKAPVPHFNFSPLPNALDRLETAARQFQSALQMRIQTEWQLDSKAEAKLDHLLKQIEPALTSDEGLPRRPWYRHLIYAPGAYTGYGVKTLPGIREAIEERRWEEVEPQTVRVAQALERCAQILDRARTDVLASARE
ncbi:MAG: M28 family peptidase [Verrucomicrobia bacterium]|nr:M28 family peptidase [Verrucomicrobiota bacterium]